MTELRLVDTYWSDHCRHTTFGTHLDGVNFENENVRAAYELYLSGRRELYGAAADDRPQTLMDIATIAAKILRKRGLLQNIDISEEVNACSIHVKASVDGKPEDWLLMFKNETHNHPTEIEPFGGRGHLYRRRDPRSAVGPVVCLSGHARNGCGRSTGAA